MKNKDTFSPDVSKRLRRTILLENGTPEGQMLELVEAILNAFENPENWPMDDVARIGLLKNLYHRARTIRETRAVL